MATELYSTLITRATQFGAHLESILNKSSADLQTLLPQAQTCDTLEQINERTGSYYTICSQVWRDDTPLTFIFMRATFQLINKLSISDIEYKTLKDLGHDVKKIQNSLLVLNNKATKLNEYIKNLEVKACDFHKKKQEIQGKLEQAKKKAEGKGTTFLSRIFGHQQRAVSSSIENTFSVLNSKTYEINDHSDFGTLLRFSATFLPLEINATTAVHVTELPSENFQDNHFQKYVVSPMKTVLESFNQDLPQMDSRTVSRCLSTLQQEKERYLKQKAHLDTDQADPDNAKVIGESWRASFVEQRDDSHELCKAILNEVEKVKDWYSVFRSHHFPPNFILTPHTGEILRRLNFQVEDLRIILQYEETTRKISEYLQTASILIPKIKQELDRDPNQISLKDRISIGTEQSRFPKRKRSCTPANKQREDEPILSIGSNGEHTPSRVHHTEGGSITPEERSPSRGHRENRIP